MIIVKYNVPSIDMPYTVRCDDDMKKHDNAETIIDMNAAEDTL